MWIGLQPVLGAEARRSRHRHLHWFRRVGDDAFSGGSLYRCRCGEVRPGF
ncbi:hypothetical protein [Blastococcus sp. CCUG 61487]|nr:hypothetical protein [Blastococcus sp. CCUG 61487]